MAKYCFREDFAFYYALIRKFSPTLVEFVRYLESFHPAMHFMTMVIFRGFIGFDECVPKPFLDKWEAG